MQKSAFAPIATHSKHERLLRHDPFQCGFGPKPRQFQHELLWAILENDGFDTAEHSVIVIGALAFVQRILDRTV